MTKIKVEHLNKTFKDLKALNDVSLDIEDGDIVCLIGPSGSGKSTLCRCIHGLEIPDSGRIYLDNELMDRTNKQKYAAQRKKMGFVFQHFNLFANKTVLQNCMLAPMSVAGKSAQEAEEIAMTYLKKVGLDGKRDAYPSKLSGGQQQRVAIARAIANRPKVLIADEPTGNLDPAMSDEIMGLLAKINREYGTTILMVTHDLTIVNKYRKRTVVLEHGHIVADLAEGGYVQHDQ